MAKHHSYLRYLFTPQLIGRAVRRRAFHQGDQWTNRLK